VLGALNAADLALELRRLGADPTNAETAAGKAAQRAVRLEGLDPAAGAVLRERMREVGGDAVVGRSAYAGVGRSWQPSGVEPLPDTYATAGGAVDVVLLGSASQVAALAERFDSSEADQTLRPLADAIRHALAMAEWQPGVLHLGEQRLDLSRRVAVMGILNVTPDSFFDGGRYDALEAAVEHGLRMVAEGADLLDVGGDSANGNAAPVDAVEEIRRVGPVIRALARQVHVPIAVDTHRAATAAAALDAGAALVNDITGLGDPAMAATVARGTAGLCVMHIKGRPKEFPPDFDYRSVMGDVARFLEERTERALAAGVTRERLVVDPGIEFGKLLHQDLELLRRLPELHVLGYPLLVAVSRKHFIGNVLGLPPEERLEGTAASVAFSIVRGARIVRVHDVKAMVRVARMTEALLGYSFDEADCGRQRSDGARV
jgi:dihydropteroate synthase